MTIPLSSFPSVEGLKEFAKSERPVFIFASGQRCGSTLLQRLLNSSPDIMIWGEQHGYLNGFLREYRALLEWENEYREHREVFLRDGYDNFTPNMLPEDFFLRQATILHIAGIFGRPAWNMGRRIWGFKEVRYDADVAMVIQRCFPNAHFIHLTRNVLNCFISLKHWENAPGPWNRSWTEVFLEDWKRINASFLSARHRVKKLMQVRYEDIIHDPDGFVCKLEEFIELRRGTLNRRVFETKIHREGVDGRIDKRARIYPRDLCQEERNLLCHHDIASISKEYGYDILFQ